MKVYRVEHVQSGKGPYNHEWLESDRIGRAHSLKSDHPAAMWDVPASLNLYPDFKCGFINMNDLFRWFGGWLPMLLKNEFRVAVHDVPEGKIHRGQCQVIFETRLKCTDWKSAPVRAITFCTSARKPSVPNSSKTLASPEALTATPIGSSNVQ